MLKRNKSLAKYLNDYAEPLVEKYKKYDGHFKHVIVIPVYDELPDKVIKIIESDFIESDILFIIVANANDSSGNGPLLRTRRLFKILINYQSNQKNSNFPKNKNGLIVVDCCSEGFLLPAKQAVGLARKTGCDLAAFYIHQGRVDGRWIHSTDADVQLPLDYFSDQNNINALSCSAAIYPFYHQPDMGFDQASRLYEQSLRYYVKGLEQANSPYGFNTIGSLLKIDVVAYAAVRGFPKRSAGEDFYLLNKLAKVGKVIALEGNPVVLAGRPSKRVPFGTGPALRKIQELREPCEEYLYYHPEIFNSLRWLLLAVNQLSEKKSTSHTVECIATCLNDISPLNNIIRVAMTASLHRINFQKILTQASDYGKTPQAFLKQFHNGFDGFKTLKFIHSMRDEGFPSINQAYLKAHCSWFTVTENLP